MSVMTLAIETLSERDIAKAIDHSLLRPELDDAFVEDGSWVYWPRRVFATADEFPKVRRQGLALALVMIGIAASGMVLGQWTR